jgi:hypothetical protein
MDDVVVMSKIIQKTMRIRDDLAVNAEKHRDLFPLNPVFGYNERLFFLN